ncbi:ABC transporter substrate-binding protein [Jiella avicenniae]|uniref:Extracellular solute-binding protein n=1 Tax=Jiella avicenniae TaxID=2907202 RepID=A0A9X1P534_9HYPH|nr:extracellular solute-binding protein [Jiella avicenniae]MCE7029406.1 extracellular solute-binding protein [Jiella avicenniae]
MRSYLNIIAVAALAVGAWMPQAHAQSDELYDEAAQEGELVYYAQGPSQVYEDLVAQFEAKYPKVKVRIVPGRYDVIEKINDQLEAGGDLDADIVTAQTMQDLVEWQEAGQLMNVQPDGIETVPEHLKRDGFFPLSIYLIGSAYNAEKLADGEAPKTVEDMLKPEFRGQLISTYPHDDDVTLYLYDQIREKYGWEFFTEFMELEPKFVRSHVLVADALKQGTSTASFDQITTFNSSEFVVPKDTPLVAFPYGIAAFAEAKHPNAAKLFLSFALTKEQQERYVSRNIWSAREDVDPPEGFEPLESYDVADGFIDFISDGDRVKELRSRFEEIIGPIEGEYISTAPSAQKQ